MTIQTTWKDDSKTVILQTYQAQWTWEEFYDSCSGQVRSMMESVSHPVHLVADMSATRSVPIGSAVMHARNVMNLYPSNWGLLVIVVNSTLIRILVDAFKNVYRGRLGNKTFAVTTLEEAYELVNNYQPTIDGA